MNRGMKVTVNIEKSEHLPQPGVRFEVFEDGMLAEIWEMPVERANEIAARIYKQTDTISIESYMAAFRERQRRSGE